MKTALYLHNKHSFPKVIDTRIEILKERLTKHYGEEVKVVPSRVAFEQGFTGDWDQWCRSLPYAKNATTRRMLYDIFITDMQVFPKATATILHEALLPGGEGKRAILNSEGKLENQPLTVFAWAPGLPLRQLKQSDLTVVDWEDYQLTAMLKDEDSSDEASEDEASDDEASGEE